MRHVFPILRLRRGLVGLLMLGACAACADATWKGARFDLNADWSAAENWDGDVPTGDAVATIGYGSDNKANVHVLGLTPPADFTGVVVVTNGASLRRGCRC